MSYWEDNSRQFPRLIAEAEAAGAFTREVLALMADSMDLKITEVIELIDRAQDVWDGLKYDTPEAEEATYAQFVTEVVITDPDTDGEVPVAIFKEEHGGMFGVDSSYLDQEEPDTVPSVFENGRVILESK